MFKILNLEPEIQYIFLYILLYYYFFIVFFSGSKFFLEPVPHNFEPEKKNFEPEKLISSQKNIRRCNLIIQMLFLNFLFLFVIYY
jgi:hypothetical protein